MNKINSGYKSKYLSLNFIKHGQAVSVGKKSSFIFDRGLIFIQFDDGSCEKYSSSNKGACEAEKNIVSPVIAVYSPKGENGDVFFTNRDYLTKKIRKCFIYFWGTNGAYLVYCDSSDKYGAAFLSTYAPSWDDASSKRITATAYVIASLLDKEVQKDLFMLDKDQVYDSPGLIVTNGDCFPKLITNRTILDEEETNYE